MLVKSFGGGMGYRSGLLVEVQGKITALRHRSLLRSYQPEFGPGCVLHGSYSCDSTHQIPACSAICHSEYGQTDTEVLLECRWRRARRSWAMGAISS